MNYGRLVESKCIVIELTKKHTRKVPYVVKLTTINEFKVLRKAKMLSKEFVNEIWEVRSTKTKK